MFWLWLLLYGLLFAVPRALMPAAAPLLTPALLAVYWAVLLRGLHTRGRLRSYGLCRGRGLTARDALLSLPVLLFAALNAAFGGAWPGAAEAVYLLFAVFGEEVLFRGVLPAVWGEKLGAARAAAASAALFALLHLGSAIGGSVSAAAVQALCAFGAGLLLTAVRARTGSIALRQTRSTPSRARCSTAWRSLSSRAIPMRKSSRSQSSTCCPSSAKSTVSSRRSCV